MVAARLRNILEDNKINPIDIPYRVIGGWHEYEDIMLWIWKTAPSTA